MPLNLTGGVPGNLHLKRGTYESRLRVQSGFSPLVTNLDERASVACSGESAHLVYGLGLRVSWLGSCVYGEGFRVQGSGFTDGVSGSWIRASGLRVQGVGCRFQG